MNIKIGNYQLAGDGRDTISDFSIEGTSRLQVVEGIRRVNVLPIDRQNVRTVIRFKVHRLFSTIDQAESFILSHGNTNQIFVGPNGMVRSLTGANACPRSGLVSIQTGTNTGRRTPMFFRAAVIETVSSQLIGVTTIHTYSMITGQIKYQKSSATDPIP